MPSFSSVKFGSLKQSVIFGSTTSSNAAALAIQNKELVINGHFIHYAEGSFDWIYVVASGKGVYKLNGLKEDGKFDWSSNLADKFGSVSLANDSKFVTFLFE